MPNQSRNSSISTKPDENQNASHCHTSHSPQNHLTSNTAPNPRNSTRQTTHLLSAPNGAALPVLDPAIAKQRQLEDQLSKTTEESLAIEKQNIQLRQRDLDLQGEILLEHGKIADLREQLFNVQDRCKHLERNAERHKSELSQFRAAVTKGLDESSERRRQIDEVYYSALNAALRSRKENLQNCHHPIAAAMRELQDGEARSDERVQTPAEQLQEVPQPRGSLVNGTSSSGGNHRDRSASGSTLVPVARMVESEQAAGTTAGPQAVDTGSRKRSVVVESSAETVSRERGVAKKVKTADQNSSHRAEGFSRTYHAISSLLGKDDVTYQKALEQLNPNNPPNSDESSRKRLKVSGPKGISRTT